MSVSAETGVPFHIPRHNMKVRLDFGDIWKQPQSRVFPDKIELYILSPNLNTSEVLIDLLK